MIAKQHWWKVLFAILALGGSAVLFMGIQTYQEAPPIGDFVGPKGETIFSADDIHAGKAVFLKYALMQYGSMFGDGGARGPDFTAEGLRAMAEGMRRYYENEPELAGKSELFKNDFLSERIRREIKKNTFVPAENIIVLNAAKASAFEDFKEMIFRKFTSPGPNSFKPLNYITDRSELKNLAAFFYWGAWVCGALRPGTSASYTQNWPFDPKAGNTVSSGALLWSVIGALAMILAVGGVLFYYGRTTGNTGWQPGADLEPVSTKTRVDAFTPTPTQRATYKFFAVAAFLFLVQVAAGVLTIHDFVGWTQIGGLDLRGILPLPVTRSWHIQLAVLWISTCWIAASIFLLPRIAGSEPKGQLGWVNVLFVLLATVVAGTLVGGFLGPMGYLGKWWSALGNQGWEFVELGRVWQFLLFLALILWAVIVVRGVWPALKSLNPFSLPHWMLYAVVAIVILFVSGFVAGPKTNFVVADFWRWMVIHMWAECFFEVFTTVIVGYFMVMMGLVGRDAATRIVYFGTLLFLGSGLVGISHNFYWNAKPEITLALGSVFSTMQVVPLILLTLEAWKFRRMPEHAVHHDDPSNGSQFGLHEAFLFLVAVNFWNFFGAGVFGFIINLPVVNYYEHGTYLTVNHGHAALMGVYGNLSLAGILFVARHLIRPEKWNGTLLQISFWTINLGLMLMVVLDLFPAGILQLKTVLEEGLAAGRAQTFIEAPTFQLLTLMRIFGGGIFILGGVFPIVWFMVSRLGSLRHL